MKKIINNRLYNTETAKKIGTYSNAGGWRDFNHYEETLYRKKTGEYFLHGEGNANTRYAKLVDANTWSGGSKIIPMNYEDARKWAEENLTADEYEAAFGAVDEGEAEKQVVSISINAAKWENARREAARLGISISEYIESRI